MEYRISNKNLMEFMIIFSVFAIISMIVIAYQSIVLSKTQNQLADLSQQLQQIQANVSNTDISINALSAKVNIIDTSIDAGKKRWAKVIAVRDAIVETTKRISTKECGILSTNTILKISGYIVDYGERYNVEIPLILAVMRRESSFCQSVTSIAGAVGIMQLMPDTAKEVMHELGIVLNIYSVNDNTRMGIYYLSKMLGEFKHDVELAVRAYNTGPTYVRKVSKGEYKGYQEETNTYWKMVSIYLEEYKLFGL